MQSGFKFLDNLSPLIQMDPSQMRLQVRFDIWSDFWSG